MSPYKKYALWAVIVLAILSILSLVMSNEYSVSVSSEINVPKNYVFNAVNHIKTYPDWYYDTSKDTAYHFKFGELKRGEQSTLEILHTTSGSSQITIVKSNMNDSIKLTEILFDSKPVSLAYYFQSEDSTKTLLEVVGQSHIGFIKNLFPFMYKWKMKRQIKKQISKLNEIVSKRYTGNTYFGHIVKPVEMNRKFYFMKRNEVEFKNIRQFYTQSISTLYQTALNKNISISGPPCGLFFKWDDVNKKSDMAAALPTFAELKFLDYETIHFDPKPAVMVEYKGDVNKSSSAHRALEDYILDHSLLNDSPIVEEYVTDPNTEEDISKWVTNIIYYTSKK